MGERNLELMAAAAPLPAPRGPLLTAQQIVERFFIDGAGRQLVSDKWVRTKVPGKIRLSYNRIAWYEREVAAWIDSRREKAG
jgi:hypothetical protein